MATMVKCPGCGEENPSKFKLCGYCGTPLATQAQPVLPAHEVRKTVTIIFSDLKGSTALGEHLDPEAMREVTDRYFSAMAAEIVRHGGKIEKYIGDAIMAVFGLPRAHEDDALRAVRAAAGMQAALKRVNEDLLLRYGVELANRTGVNTGEVVANDDPTVDQKLATGDAVNVAARLEQAAPDNQIYLGEITYRLVRDAVEVETVEPLSLKGKEQRVPAFRLVSVVGLDGNRRGEDTPVVGRDLELAALEALYEDVSVNRVARLATVIGDAGVGKSRLVHAVTERIALGARELRGRCLPYGDGITFWPLRGMLTEVADIRVDDSPEEARAKVLGIVGDPDVADRLDSAVGLDAAQFPLLELYWATRKFLEGQAAERPVIAIFDDIHWADPALLGLIEHILDSSSGAPVLMLATTRHDLIEEQPEWGERPGAIRLVLRPLSNTASAQVVANLLGAADLPKDVLDRIIGAAEGNPLFVEQMLSMLIDGGALRQEDGCWVRAEKYGEIAVPPTIQALLEARLDRLRREERAAVDPASVIGLEFAQTAVEALAPAAVRETIDKHLTALSNKQFIRPAEEAGQVGPRYRFDHHLVRDTVYNGLLKRARATLHVAFVRWADLFNAQHDRGLEFEEILGYHLEQAHRYLSELGPLDAQGIAIGNDAAGRLSSAARRAFARGDMESAATLFRRAIALLPADDPQRTALLPTFGETLIGLGDFAGARAALDQARSAAERIGDERVKASCQLVDIFIRLFSGEPGDGGDAMMRTVDGLIPLLERENADDELATAWRLIVLVHGIAGRYSLASEAAERSIVHARRAGDDRLIAKIGGILTNTALLGPTPVPQAITQCEDLIAGGLSDRQVEANTLCVLAQLRAMNGELATARSLYQRGRAILRDLAAGVSAAATGLDVARVELLGGDLALAEREVRADYKYLAAIGETYYLSSMAALLSRIVRDLGRDDEALALSKTAEEATAADDVVSQSMWRSIRAPILARAGDLVGAEEMAKAAVDLLRTSEAPDLQADALAELGAVLHMAGKTEESHKATAEAVALYGVKGNLAAAARAVRSIGA